jgi:hypothetical protein
MAVTIAGVQFTNDAPVNAACYTDTNNKKRTVVHVYAGRSKSLCAPDDYSTKNTQKYFKQFQSLTMIT